MAEVGVGPWPGEWPPGEHWDPDLLRDGDRRNVVDHYRYWRHDAIVTDLDTRRHDFHVAVENWGHDFNIGSVIRTANAMNAKAFHIVGKRRWNRRGAMVTDRYQHEHHHPDAEALAAWAHAEGLTLVGHRQPARLGPARDARPAAGLRPRLRPGGPRAVGADAGRLRGRAPHRAVRLDPLDQRRRGRGDRDARVGPPPRLRPAPLTSPPTTPSSAHFPTPGSGRGVCGSGHSMWPARSSAHFPTPGSGWGVCGSGHSTWPARSSAHFPTPGSGWGVCGSGHSTWPARSSAHFPAPDPASAEGLPAAPAQRLLGILLDDVRGHPVGPGDLEDDLARRGR